ncbi:MAG: hypothetical protein ABIU63_09510 [Chitinophagaceae bacterium]
MKTNVFAVLMLLATTLTYSCKEHKQENSDQTSTVQPATEASPASGTKPKDYVVTAFPDTILLGKNKEAFIRIKDLKAIELSNSDGTSAGIELSYKIELTNRNSIGGHGIGIPTTDFRLELDNGNKIAPNSIFVNAEPEATKLSDYDKFILAAGSKPVALNLFFDQTRGSIKLELK